jgi:hypothetical protein
MNPLPRACGLALLIACVSAVLWTAIPRTAGAGFHTGLRGAGRRPPPPLPVLPSFPDVKTPVEISIVTPTGEARVPGARVLVTGEGEREDGTAGGTAAGGHADVWWLDAPGGVVILPATRPGDDYAIKATAPGYAPSACLRVVTGGPGRVTLRLGPRTAPGARSPQRGA